MTISKILNLFKEFNDSYSNGVIAITITIGAFFAYYYKKIYEESQRDKGDAYFIVKPIFWTFGKKFKILAVHKFEKSDDISGYKDVGQNSRPDQWKKLINIKSSMNIRFKIEPINKDDILIIIISRNGKEKWRSITFNR